MTEFLSQVKGFTPCIDVMIKKHGLVTAAVYGRVWRFCQMEDQICRASHQRIAEDLGLNRRTVLEHLKKLCKLGFLKDTTPNLRNKPHTYKDTGKAKIFGMIGAEVDGVNEIPSGVNINHTGCESNSQEDSIEDSSYDATASCPLAPQSEHDQLLFNLINKQRAAKGFRSIKAFPNEAVRDKFRAAAAKLDGHLERAITCAFTNANTIALNRVVNYIAKWRSDYDARTYKRDSAAPQQSTDPRAPGYVIPVIELASPGEGESALDDL